MAKNKEQTEEIKNTQISEEVAETVILALKAESKSGGLLSKEKINWFKKIPVEYLYLNESKRKSIEKRLNKPFGEVTKEEALETELIINLAGIRFLLDTVGYKYSKVTINSCNPEYAAATCEICFNPGEFNNNQEQIYTQSASAHPGNTKSWYKDYLVEAAANRAFCRAVRFYCNVQCVSADELGSNNVEDSNPNGNSPSIDSQVENVISQIETYMKHEKINFTWEQIKNKLITEKTEGAENFSSLRDVPKNVLFNLLDRLKKAVAKKEKETSK